VATDAIVVTNSNVVRIETMAMTTIVQLSPMQPGRSYLVWATGLLHAQNALVTIELEAFDAKDTIDLYGGAGAIHHSFSLAVGTTLPPDDDLFTVAKLSAAIKDVLSPNEPADVATETARLVVLAVDSVAVQAV
jgi:hypothetical protein